VLAAKVVRSLVMLLNSDGVDRQIE